MIQFSYYFTPYHIFSRTSLFFVLKWKIIFFSQWGSCCQNLPFWWRKFFFSYLSEYTQWNRSLFQWLVFFLFSFFLFKFFSFFFQISNWSLLWNSEKAFAPYHWEFRVVSSGYQNWHLPQNEGFLFTIYKI